MSVENRTDYQKSIDGMREAFDAMFALLAVYPQEKCEQPGACGDWSSKEVMAHFSGWMVIALRRFDDFAAGDMGHIFFDWDPTNAESVAERAHLTWEETREDLRDMLGKFLARAEQVDPEMAARDSRYQEWLNDLRVDCLEHTDELRRFAYGSG
jgi:hypothetical protein